MENNYNTGGIGFVGLLQIVFITLKLLGVISWSWVWVLSPTWIWISIVILLVVVLVLRVIFYEKKHRKR